MSETSPTKLPRIPFLKTYSCKSKTGEKAPKHTKLVSKQDIKNAIDGKWVAANQLLESPKIQNLPKKASCELPIPLETTPKKHLPKNKFKQDINISGMK